MLFCANQGLSIRSVPPDFGSFRRGDANGDGRQDLADPVWMLVGLFLGGPFPPCKEAADVNDDGSRNITDAIYSLSWHFLGGPAPRGPFPGCGYDPDSTPESCPPGSNGDCL